jgi:hypothetical protein
MYLFTSHSRWGGAWGSRARSVCVTVVSCLDTAPLLFHHFRVCVFPLLHSSWNPPECPGTNENVPGPSRSFQFGKDSVVVSSVAEGDRLQCPDPLCSQVTRP